jgi:hypothetical protein
MKADVKDLKLKIQDLTTLTDVKLNDNNYNFA